MRHLLGWKHASVTLMCVTASATSTGTAPPPPPPPSASDTSRWDWSHRGDVRAVVTVPPSLLGSRVSASIVWRRHDAEPETKKVIVTDSNGTVVESMAPVVTQHYGVVCFLTSAGENNTYFVYYMPYTQSGIGAGFKFSWDTADPDNLVSVGQFTAQSGTSKMQEFDLAQSVSTSQLRWNCLKAARNFQVFVNEVVIGCDTNSTNPTCASSGWMPNHATATDPYPVSGSSGSQPSADGNGPAWKASDGNLTSYWDSTVSTAWLDLSFNTVIRVAAVQLYNYGDITHDCIQFELLVPSSNRSDWRRLPVVPEAAIEIESRTEFDTFVPMELAANDSEVDRLLAARGSPPYLVFTETREYPIRMQDRIPIHWTTAPPSPVVNATVLRGEYFTWQLGLFVPAEAARLQDVRVAFHGFGGGNPTCFNLMGVDPQGNAMNLSVSIEANTVRSLWFGINISSTLAPGTEIDGGITIQAVGVPAISVPVHLIVSGDPPQVVEPDPTKMTRLRWLNSELYTHDYGLVEPYEAIVKNGTSIRLLNRELSIGPEGGAGAGLLSSVVVTRPASRFGTLSEKKIQVLSAPMTLSVASMSEESIQISNFPSQCGKSTSKWDQRGAGLLSWEMTSGATLDSGQNLCIVTNMSLGMEGYLKGSVTLRAAPGGTAPQAINLTNVVISIPLAKQYGLSWMGLGARGLDGSTPGTLSLYTGNFSWRWNDTSTSNQLFVGSALAGLKLRPIGNTSEWYSPIERNYDVSEALPDEWGANNHLGGIDCKFRNDKGVDVALKTGPQVIGESSSSSSSGVLTLNFELTLTPFKTPNETQHWSLRHFQVGYPGSTFTSVADVKKSGANVINIHQGVSTMINPYINYPFVPESVDLLANYTAEANAQGMRVKYYYTVRELTNHAAEIFALRMLGDEVYVTPSCGYNTATDCGGAAWHRQHLGGNYSPAWICPLSNGEYDAAIRQNKLAGRWLNYYIEGLRQSVSNAPYIQGIYYDGILFGRDTMLRARKVLERDTQPGHPRPLMDMHTGNDEPAHQVVDATMYANNWAFVDSLWIGEGFSYNSFPVFWLFEISGLAFGVFSDMLGPPNVYRGMLFGSTGRPGCTFPTPMWQFWDSFQIQNTDMVGFWQEDTPVAVANQTDIFHSDDGAVLATAYVNKLEKKTLVAIASWASTVSNVSLVVNWTALGMNYSSPKEMSAPEISGFQSAKDFGVITEQVPTISVPPAGGWLLVFKDT